MPRIVAAVLLFLGASLACAGTVSAQVDSMPTGKGSFKDPAQRAAASYGRGARAKRKAEETTDPGEKQKLYTRAKEELTKSVGYQGSFDAFLALGQVHLALGDKKNAGWACAQAQALKPVDVAAKSCIETASKPDNPPPDVVPSTPTPVKPPGSPSLVEQS